MKKNFNYYQAITNLLEWVDSETLEWTYDWIYYKFITINYNELYGYYSDNMEPPGELVPVNVRWATKKEIYDYVTNGGFESQKILSVSPKFQFSGYIVERNYDFETEDFIMNEFKEPYMVSSTNNNWLLVLTPALNYVLSNETFKENYIKVMSDIINNENYWSNIKIQDIENIFNELKYSNLAVEKFLMKKVLDKVIYEPAIFNPFLLEKNNRNISTNWKNIVKLQTLRSIIYHLIDIEFITLDDELLNLIYLINADLSVEWWFSNNNIDVDWNYFKFWEIPTVWQPSLDNNDSYPYGVYSFIERDNFSIKMHNNSIKYTKNHKLDI